MKRETRDRLDNLSMRNLMIVLTAIGIVAVPVLWTLGHLEWAVAVGLLIAMLVLQSALIDLPGLSYRALNRSWTTLPRKPVAPVRAITRGWGAPVAG
jgi:hypothetical protein